MLFTHCEPLCVCVFWDKLLLILSFLFHNDSSTCVCAWLLFSLDLLVHSSQFICSVLFCSFLLLLIISQFLCVAGSSAQLMSSGLNQVCISTETIFKKRYLLFVCFVFFKCFRIWCLIGGTQTSCEKKKWKSEPAFFFTCERVSSHFFACVHTTHKHTHTLSLCLHISLSACFSTCLFSCLNPAYRTSP